MSYSNGYGSDSNWGTENDWNTSPFEGSSLSNGYEPPQDQGGGSWGANPMDAEVNPDSALGEGWGVETNGGFEPDGWDAPSSSVMGAGDTPYQTDLYSDGYQENVYEANFLDTPYGETSANPNPGR